MKIHLGDARLLRATLCLLLVLLSSKVIAQSDMQPNTTGNVFYAICGPRSPSYQTCIYYVIGYTDGLNVTNAVLEQAGQQKMFCVPSSRGSTFSALTGVQEVDLIMNYLQRNPQRRHEIIPGLIIQALKEAFPCH